MVKILIFINFSLIKIVDMMSQGDFFWAKKQRKTYMQFIEWHHIRKLYQWKVDDDENFDYKDILDFFLEWSKHIAYKKSYKALVPL